MARGSARYVCQECGSAYRKWAGRCESCGAWNSIVEETPGPQAGPGPAGARLTPGTALDFVPLDLAAPDRPRWITGNAEFDRVCGGGLVRGSAILIGGDPGIGKSTLLLQVACRAAGERRCAYISGEEAVEQIQARAARLGLAEAPVRLAAATDVRDIIASLEGRDAPELVIVDSIQTMFVDTVESAPGTVAQVRASAAALIGAAKRRGVVMVLVGHVTKDGAIAGPRVLEHMVDTTVYFEGDRGHQFRILRSVKNRFGAADEIGVFEMTGQGLVEVANPSALFLADRAPDGGDGRVSGAAVFAGLEGTRPVLMEIQALVAPSSLGTPRRAVVGWDAGRLSMVLAVLEARCGIAIGMRDVYLNVAGGLRVQEPAADLAVAAALLSSLGDSPVPHDAVVFGEIGLSGEVRPVAQMELRLREAAKLGFVEAVGPARPRRAGTPLPETPRLREIPHVRHLVPLFGLEDGRMP